MFAKRLLSAHLASDYYCNSYLVCSSKRLSSFVVHHKNTRTSYRKVNKTTMITLVVANDLCRAVRFYQKKSGFESVLVIILARVSAYKAAKSTSIIVSESPREQQKPVHLSSNQNIRPGIEKSSVCMIEK